MKGAMTLTGAYAQHRSPDEAIGFYGNLMDSGGIGEGSVLFSLVAVKSGGGMSRLPFEGEILQF
jgi:hypothetical protein